MAPAGSAAFNYEMFERRMSAVEQNSMAHASTFTAYNEKFNEIETSLAVAAEREKNSDARLERIEADIKDIKNLGKWVLATFGAGLLLALTDFVIHGGLIIK